MSTFGTAVFGTDVFGTAGPDTTPPSVPSGLAAVAVSSSQINLSWSASTDNVGVTGYTVYRNTVSIGTTPSTSYANGGLAASTSYSYRVDAFDAAGNHSAQSSAASATSLAATPPPQTNIRSIPSVSSRLGPMLSTLGTTYSSGQVSAMVFGSALQVEWRWDLLDNQFNYKLDLTPLLAADHAPTISNDSTRAVKRQLTNLLIRADSRINYYQDIVRPRFRLLAPDGGWLEWPLSYFMLTPPNREISSGITWWTITAPDLTQLLVDAAFDTAVSVNAGTLYTEAVAFLLSSYGGATPLVSGLRTSRLRLPAPLNWDAGTNYLKAINDLLVAINYVPAAMYNNVLISEPQPDWTVQIPDLVLDAVRGQAVLIGPFTEQADYTNAYNIVRVSGTDPRRAPVFGFYRNTHTESPVSIFRWHPRTKVVQDSSLASDSIAQARAITEAQSAARVYAILRVGLPVFPFMQDLDVVYLTYSSVDDGVVSYPYLCLHWAHPCEVSQPTTVDLQRIVQV